MINQGSNICILGGNKSLTERVEASLKALRFINIDIFDDPDKALAQAQKKKYYLFISQIRLKKFSGIVFLQKLRKLKSYGEEVHIFMPEQEINEQVFNILLEYDVPYTIVPPFTPKTITKALTHVLKTEKSLSTFESTYRKIKYLVRLKDYAASLRMGNELLKANTLSEKLHLLVGDIHIALNDLTQAKALYRKALTLNQNSLVASHKLARCYMMEGLLDKAVDLMESVKMLNPLNIELVLNLGDTYVGLGELNSAKDCFNHVKKIDQTNTESREKLVDIHLTQGNTEAISNELEEVYSADETVRYLNNTAIMMVHKKEFKRAQDLYNSCMKIINQSTHKHILLYNIGLSYARINDKETALRYLQEVVKIAPTFTKGQSALSNVRDSSPAGQKITDLEELTEIMDIDQSDGPSNQTEEQKKKKHASYSLVYEKKKRWQI